MARPIRQSKTILLMMIVLFLAACDSATTSGNSGSNTTGNTVERYTVNQTTVSSHCAITPRARNMEIVQEADPGSTIIGVLPEHNTVQVSQRSEDGMYQVHLPNTPVNNGWIAARGVEIQEDCACGTRCLDFEVVTLDTPITDCEVAFAPDDFITIYSVPVEGASVFGVSTAGDAAAGLAQAVTEDGWIGYDPGLNNGETGVARLRWIHGNDTAISLNGTQCIDLPTYTYVPSGE